MSEQAPSTLRAHFIDAGVIRPPRCELDRVEIEAMAFERCRVPSEAPRLELDDTGRRRAAERAEQYRKGVVDHEPADTFQSFLGPRRTTRLGRLRGLGAVR